LLFIFCCQSFPNQLGAASRTDVRVFELVVSTCFSNGILNIDACSSWDRIPARLCSGQGCQIFIGPKYQSGEKYTKLPQNIPNGHKIFPMAVKYVDQMVIKYTKIFRSKTFQNLPKLGFLVWKQTIWQPW
jgi:hypothetical protein